MPQTRRTSSVAPGTGLQLILIGVLCLIWGSTWLVIAEGLDELPPLTSLASRFALAGSVFAALAPRLHAIEGGAAPTWPLRLVMGGLNFALSYAVIYWVEQTVPSGLTSVLWGTFPILIAVGAHFCLPGERLRWLSSLGLVVGLGGVALLFATDLRTISAAALRAGAVLTLSPLAAAAGNLYVKRHAAGTSSVLLCRDGLLLAAAVLVPLAFTVERPLAVAWTARGIGSIAYLGVVGTVVAFALYFWLLRFTPVFRLSLISYVTPAVALGLGWLVRGEPIGATTLTGTALIVVGTALAGRKR
ncbi:MAG: DMT family transporter [Planctomycetota bacterium]